MRCVSSQPLCGLFQAGEGELREPRPAGGGAHGGHQQPAGVPGQVAPTLRPHHEAPVPARLLVRGLRARELGRGR